HRLKYRRLAGAVRPDDAGDPVTEDDLGVGMLAKVHKPQPMQLHPVPPPVSLSARAAVSRYSTPSFTNVSRFSSASRGRRPRKSCTVSVSVCRRPPGHVRWPRRCRDGTKSDSRPWQVHEQIPFAGALFLPPGTRALRGLILQLPPGIRGQILEAPRIPGIRRNRLRSVIVTQCDVVPF